jgi:hypothetical protein
VYPEEVSERLIEVLRLDMLAKHGGNMWSVHSFPYRNKAQHWALRYSSVQEDVKHWMVVTRSDGDRSLNRIRQMTRVL